MIAGQPHAIHMTMMMTPTAVLLATLGIGRAQETPAGARPWTTVEAAMDTIAPLATTSAGAGAAATTRRTRPQL
jgi:hypothetical protein